MTPEEFQQLNNCVSKMATQLEILTREVNSLRHHVMDGNGDSILTRLRLIESKIAGAQDRRRWIIPVGLSLISLGLAGAALVWV